MSKKNEAVAQTKGLGISELMALEPVKVMGLIVANGGISVEIKAPSPEVLELLTGSDQILEQAAAFEITDDATYKLADLMWTQLKDDADAVELGRTETTKAINRVKIGWDATFAPGRDDRLKGVTILQAKMKAYEDKCATDAKALQDEQERLARLEQDKLRTTAEELEEKAAQAKSPKRREALLQKAAGLKMTATIIPTEFATVESAVPKTAGSGRAAPWVGEVTDPTKFLGWLVGNPLWLNSVEFKTAVLNDLAKRVTNTMEVPGFKAERKRQFRRDPKRNG